MTRKPYLLHSVLSMSPSLRPSRPARIVPKWANLPRRKCDNCGKSYKPARPLRSIDKHGFCGPECKKAFHKNGGAHRQLKAEIEKAIARLRLTTEERCNACKGTAMLKYGKFRGSRCMACIDGKVLTPFGREILGLVASRLEAHANRADTDISLFFQDTFNP